MTSIKSSTSIHDTVDACHKQLLADSQTRLTASGNTCTKIITIVQLVKKLASQTDSKTVYQYNRLSIAGVDTDSCKGKPQLDIVLSLNKLADKDSEEWTLQTNMPVHPGAKRKAKKEKW